MRVMVLCRGWASVLHVCVCKQTHTKQSDPGFFIYKQPHNTTGETSSSSSSSSRSSSSSSSSSKSSSGGSSNGNSGDSGKVVTLTDDNFKETVVGSKDLWLVAFIAPWCGYCKKLQPEWKDAAKRLKGQVKLGWLDATAYQTTAGKFDVRGYPTIKVRFFLSLVYYINKMCVCV